MDGQAALWAAILASGVYHGLNPGMGWPLAVAAGLTQRRDRIAPALPGPGCLRPTPVGDARGFCLGYGPLYPRPPSRSPAIL